MLKVKTINNNKYFKIILLRLSLCLVHQCIRHVEIRTCTQNWVCVQIPTCAIHYYTRHKWCSFLYCVYKKLTHQFVKFTYLHPLKFICSPFKIL